jgi:hypothetical protein
MLSVVILNVIMLSVVMLNVVMLSVVAPPCAFVCHPVLSKLKFIIMILTKLNLLQNGLHPNQHIFTSVKQSRAVWRHDTQPKDIQPNDIQHTEPNI